MCNTGFTLRAPVLLMEMSLRVFSQELSIVFSFVFVLKICPPKVWKVGSGCR